MMNEWMAQLRKMEYSDKYELTVDRIIFMPAVSHLVLRRKAIPKGLITRQIEWRNAADIRDWEIS